jgi:hypothetical protein
MIDLLTSSKRKQWSVNLKKPKKPINKLHYIKWTILSNRIPNLINLANLYQFPFNKDAVLLISLKELQLSLITNQNMIHNPLEAMSNMMREIQKLHHKQIKL